MPKFSTVSCYECGEDVEKPQGEINRSLKLGRKFFCGSSCSAKNRNRPYKAKEIIRQCLHCGLDFQSTTKKKGAKYCSRSCASAGSMNPQRRESQRLSGVKHSGNLNTTDETLKQRESWKYQILREVLKEIPHEFEYRLEDRVYDLAILNSNILVEFDGPDHLTPKQVEIDLQKDEIARRNGFVLVRRSVLSMEVISPETIEDLL